MALQRANVSGYTCNCTSVKWGSGARITALLLSQYIEKCHKKCPVTSVLNVLQLKGLDAVVSSDWLKDVDSMPVGQGSAMGRVQYSVLGNLYLRE
jgi:hypothetical protein